MENISIKQTDDSPQVTMNFEKRFIEFDGECYPENAFEFFEPILEWLKNYLNQNIEETTTINFKLSYFNSATTQVLFDIFDELEASESELFDINWFYDKNNKNTFKDYEEFNEEFKILNIKAIGK